MKQPLSLTTACNVSWPSKRERFTNILCHKRTHAVLIEGLLALTPLNPPRSTLNLTPSHQTKRQISNLPHTLSCSYKKTSSCRTGDNSSASAFGWVLIYLRHNVESKTLQRAHGTPGSEFCLVFPPPSPHQTCKAGPKRHQEQKQIQNPATWAK